MKIKDERWKAVVGYEGLYEVSDFGNVRSLNYMKTWKVNVLKPGNCHGYLRVKLSKDGKTKDFLVHRLVYEAFRGAIPKGLTVDHVNGDKSDNRLENLQLLTQRDNARKSNNKQLDLMLAEWPYSELTFSNSREASFFFGYKREEQIGVYISRARKRGKNFINLKGTRYFFAQEA